MISTTHGRAYELCRQIHAKALQLEIQMSALSSVIASTYCWNDTEEQTRKRLDRLFNYTSEQAEGYAAGMQELCRLIKESHEVLQEGTSHEQ